ncbi:MAG: RNA polymerase sigma factor [Candidatus Kapaibacterium sp.]
MTDLARHFQAFLAGDDAAFAPLYREVNPRLAAYCHKLAGSRAGSTAPRAEDLMQELWERVIGLRSRGTAPPVVDSPLAFLFRIAKNLAVDEFRRRKNETPLAEDETNGTYTTHAIHSAEFEQSTDVEAIILEALEKLPAEDREVLVLNIYSGYNFGEIAEMLGTTVEAAWQRASRARMKLRKIVIEDAKRMGVALPRMNGSVARTKETIL